MFKIAKSLTKTIILAVLLLGPVFACVVKANLPAGPPQNQNTPTATAPDTTDAVNDPTSNNSTKTKADDNGSSCSKVNPHSIGISLPFGGIKDKAIGTRAPIAISAFSSISYKVGTVRDMDPRDYGKSRGLAKMGPGGSGPAPAPLRYVYNETQKPLIKQGVIKLSSASPSPKLFSPQGLQYDFAFESYMTVDRDKFTVRRPNGYDIEYDATGVPTGNMEKSYSRVKLPDSSTPYGDGKILPNDENSSWSPPTTYERTFPDGSKAIFSRYTITNNVGYYKAGKIKTAFGKELQSTDPEIGIDVIRDGDKSLKQIKSSTDGLTNIEVVDQYKYKVKFYKPEDVGAKQDGVYQVNEGATPKEEWTFENPQRSDTLIDKVKVTKTAGGVSKVYDWEYIEASKSWKVGMGDSTEARVSYKTEITNLETGETTVTAVAKDSSDNVKYKKQETYAEYDFGKAIKEKVVDPDGVALKTEYAYNANSTLQSKKHPGGMWEKISYGDAGNLRRVEIRRPVKNLAFSAGSGGRGWDFDYASHDVADTVVSTDNRPRTTTEEVDGVTVSKKFLVDKTVGTERIVIEEIAATPSAAYGATGNLRTTTVYDTATAYKKSVTFPDGKKDTYTYEKGNYTPGSQVPGTFTVDANGDCIRETIVHGTTASPSGIAYKTTKEIIIYDERSDIVLKELYVYTGSAYEKISWEVYVFDSEHHLTNTYMSNNTQTSATWNCCNKESETLADGSEYTYTYDSLDRVKTKTKKGISGSTPDIVTTYTYDSESRVTSVSIYDGTHTLTTSATYDVAGRVTSKTDFSGLVTSYSYTKATSTTGDIVTATYPDSSTKITEKYFDGRIKSVTGTAVVATYYDYGVDTGNGNLWSKESIGSAASTRYTKTYTNSIGKVAKIEKSGYNTATITTQFYYNNSGQLWKKTQTALADTLYEYDSLGNQTRSGLDISDNGTLDLASADRISDIDAVFSLISSDWWLVTTMKFYATNNDNTATTTSVRKIRLTGLTNGTIAELKQIDINGNETGTNFVIDSTNKTMTRTINVPDSSINTQDTIINGLLISQRSASNLITTFNYDGLGRLTSTADPRTGTTTIVYYTSGTGKIGKVYTITDAASNITTFDYNTTTGRIAWAQNALSKKTYYDYNDRGQITNVWGDAGYPVEKAYDTYGQNTTLKTYRAGTGWTGSSWPTATTGTADTTTWAYDTSSGLVTSKTFADSNNVAYTYTNEGRFLTRTWDRTSGGNSLITTYSYDANTGEQTGINYSDSTQDISFSYTRTGQQYQVTDTVGTRTFAYNTALQPTTETISGGLYSKTISRDYAATGVVGRYTGFHIGTEYDVDYGYDTYGRFNTVTNGDDVYTYAYLASSDLVSGVTRPNNLTTDYSYEANRNLMTTVANKYNTTTTISNYVYRYDNVGKRNDVVNTGTAFTASNLINWTYNDRSELLTAKKYNSTNPDSPTNAVTAYDYALAFDNIGNRSSYNTSTGGTATTYTLNNINQYTATANPTLSLTYDTDGNMLTAGSANGTWNGENRLIEIYDDTTGKKVEFVYDYAGRRVEKKVYTGTSGTSWTLNTHEKFVYDGYKCIEVLDGANSNAILQKFLWSGDELLSVYDVAATSTYYYFADANKNIGQLMDSSGNAVAKYEYSPFGVQTSSTGAYAATNPFRFSSEYYDSETELVYYNYRYYSPALGKWLSRDPIEEEGGSNLYTMVLNDPIGWWDYLGMKKAPKVVLSVKGMTYTYHAGKWRAAKGSSRGGKFVSPKEVAAAWRSALKSTTDKGAFAKSAYAKLFQKLSKLASTKVNPFKPGAGDLLSVIKSVADGLNEFSRNRGNCIAALKAFSKGNCSEGIDRGFKCAKDVMVEMGAGGGIITSGTAIDARTALEGFFGKLNTLCREAHDKKE
jgi:RHS repeat-associated protein